jgi:hypothetical protein
MNSVDIGTEIAKGELIFGTVVDFGGNGSPYVPSSRLINYFPYKYRLEILGLRDPKY